MTADLYVREGSRFVRVGDTLIARDVPPIPVPAVVEDEDPAPNAHRVPVTRCAHGHYCRPGGPGRGCPTCRPTARTTTTRRNPR